MLVTVTAAPSPVDDLLSLRDILRYAVSRFAEAGIFCGHGTDNYWDEAVYLVLRSVHLPLENNAIFLDARLTREERVMLIHRIDRRVGDRVPTAYITGEAWFMGLRFQVDERVLIPRSPLAEILEERLHPWLAPDRPVQRILDLCTGSGCIGIAAAHVFPEAEVVLADLSPEALAVAEANIHEYGLEDRVRCVQSDLFDRITGPFDLILTNPPYVDAQDLDGMPPEFHWEPRLGLAAGDDGLDIAHRILAEATEFLTPEGLLFAEVGNSWVALDEAYPQAPFTWLNLEEGGHGLFVISAAELRALNGNLD